ncbi:unnamed protein product [Anisakis simplex]|uniref:Secreted protein n=1 Tax=Anisakis simplex TaxID=6269 RepID=A0A0M3J1W7_ANISI|nr:unnamed protein product [Anisakis simplex]
MSQQSQSICRSATLFGVLAILLATSSDASDISVKIERHFPCSENSAYESGVFSDCYGNDEAMFAWSMKRNQNESNL